MYRYIAHHERFPGPVHSQGLHGIQLHRYASYLKEDVLIFQMNPFPTLLTDSLSKATGRKLRRAQREPAHVSASALPALGALGSMVPAFTGFGVQYVEGFEGPGPSVGTHAPFMRHLGPRRATPSQVSGCPPAVPPRAAPPDNVTISRVILLRTQHFQQFITMLILILNINQAIIYVFYVLCFYSRIFNCRQKVTYSLFILNKARMVI